MWLDDHESQNRSKSPSKQRLIDQGKEVGEYARRFSRFSQGTLIEEGSKERSIEQTQELIDQGEECLFEATFLANEVLVKCDVLLKEGDSWNLIEVKSSTRVKDEHYPDLAIQLYVLKQCGLNVGKIELMLINNTDCVYPNLENLFKFEDLTSEIIRYQQDIEDPVEYFKNVLAQDAVPDVSIGKQCNTPKPCPFIDKCWSDIPEASFDTIPRLHWDKKQNLLSRGILHARDADVSLTGPQQEYVDMQRSGEPVIDRKAIQEKLNTLVYPLYFLDFETINPAIPRYAGMKPYGVFPFQYSCHIVESLKAEAELREYLCTEDYDPREEFLKSLLRTIGNNGSVICYSSYEKTILGNLKEVFSVYGAAIDAVIARLWDLEVIFKKHYKHPGFLGKTSIKSVLPVLVPDAGYENLNIQGGSDASALWQQMIDKDNAEEKREIEDSLREYCQYDTLAMVKLWKHLVTI